MTGKWGEIQGKLDLVRVNEAFELSGLSEFELWGFCCTCFDEVSMSKLWSPIVFVVMFVFITL